MGFWENRFEAEKVIIIIEQFANWLMKKLWKNLIFLQLRPLNI